MTLSRGYQRRQRSQPRNQQIVVFNLRQERFAFPIQVAQRVAPVTNLYGTTLGGHLGLIHLNQQHIPILDIEYQIFSDRPSDPSIYTYVLILDNPFGNPMGIPLYAPPLLSRVAEKAFQPVPPSYASDAAMQCIAALVTIDDQKPIFLINPAQLLSSHASALPDHVPNSHSLRLDAQHNSL